MRLSCPICGPAIQQEPDPYCTRCGGDGFVCSCKECNVRGDYSEVNPDCPVCLGFGDVPEQAGGGGCGGNEI